MLHQTPSSPSLRIHERLADVPRAAWDALVDAAATPFVRWGFLEAFEASGCAVPAAGWSPRHLGLWRGDRLIAAAPAYARDGSDGDFGRDWEWADFAQRVGVRYYPKLVLGVPFTPCTGRRVLVAAGEDRGACVAAIARGARELAAAEGWSSIHVLFPLPGEVAELEAAGLARRVDFQCHWINRGYRDPADFMARALDAKRRHQHRRERAAPAARGIELATIRGDELAADPERWGRAAHGFYRATVDKLAWGRPWLNQAFFERAFAALPDAVEVVVARRAGREIAGAFNVQGGDRLYGRSWGCHEEHPFLHFNVCLYHSIDDCIARGIQVFEGGAGGEHKLPRGFELAPTFSAHTFVDPRLDGAIRDHLMLETRHRLKQLAAWRAEHVRVEP